MVIEWLLIGLAISTAVAAAGYFSRALTSWGAVTATIVGTAIIWGTSWGGAVLLGAFFVSSSALSKFLTSLSLDEKTDQRDSRQVFANGGVAALAGVSALWGSEIVAFTVVAGSLAAATSDTWATEIGSLSREQPKFIATRIPVLVGESGGVTMLGLSAAAGGAVFLGLLATFIAQIQYDTSEFLAMIAIISVAGFAGSLVDSLAGEYLQSKRWCPYCQEVSEAERHSCGQVTEWRSGIGWIDNDVVNLICTSSAAALSLVMAWMIFT